ncbi:Bug family tripartite tricarboxylate transporter substrate binding protein [Comamonas terrigena]|uniref:Bug family tripartite tricarboxylate transporter substrate binding protein n=1 Tax=Comamonas terrigena TaxID=32013 RepID=UPI0024479EC8|nr:tripartite tricarboxylate transporter substrate binding protein [Comamonas terrigena]MDH0049672.1 tripartite tricarboxylate transporter substrate binding protein [Comamonas terrigena]MDH0511324.1 tripartite tricarboxylate transporter substrate binding protein [Comamonas terrigena]MDH1091373.1 tripartite tricarboxylate transporter substrate binding protein [Comamonas terrigena]MDH1501767.1 tripartite tricarboxylate transporter substrate binding protein [Comamonas terrigena]
MALLPTLPTIPSLTRRQLLQSSSALGLAATLPGLHAQANWPTKSIRFVVPFAPGGSSEIVARSTAAELSKSLGQSVYVENKPGAAGNIAMQEVARADDQHTVVLGHIGTLAVNPYIFPKLPYDPNKDFQPVSLLAKVPSLYVVHPDVPAKNLKEFVAYVRANPGKFSYGSAGNGSAGHLAFEYLKMTANLFMLHVPYKGTGPMMTDLLSGRLDAASVGASALLPFIKSGKVRCIATGSTKRLAQLPDVPTVAEQGFPGFEMTQWYGMLAPANLQAGHVERLAAECKKAVQAPDALKRLQGDAADPIGGSPAEFARFIATEQARWKQVLLRAQVKPD